MKIDHNKLNEIIASRPRNNPVWAKVWNGRERQFIRPLVSFSVSGSCRTITDTDMVDYVDGKELSDLCNIKWEHYEVISPLPELEDRHVWHTQLSLEDFAIVMDELYGGDISVPAAYLRVYGGKTKEGDMRADESAPTKSEPPKEKRLLTAEELWEMRIHSIKFKKGGWRIVLGINDGYTGLFLSNDDCYTSHELQAKFVGWCTDEDRSTGNVRSFYV